jgi:hypothetical protein
MMMNFERDFSPHAAVAFAANNWAIPIVCVSAYLLFVIIGPFIMKNRKPFDLEKPLAAWNGLLCVFSCMGMIKTVRD